MELQFANPHKQIVMTFYEVIPEKTFVRLQKTLLARGAEHDIKLIEDGKRIEGEVWSADKDDNSQFWRVFSSIMELGIVTKLNGIVIKDITKK